jgi:hypothetical protein
VTKYSQHREIIHTTTGKQEENERHEGLEE